MYDYSTKNQSFIEVSKTLKEMGIKNCEFMLELKNEDLYYLDPYDPHLSFQDKINILNECRNNIWYFLREIVKVPAQGGGSVPFKLDMSNCAQVYLPMLNCNNWITKPRQTSGSMSSIVLGDYFRIFYTDPWRKRTYVYLCDI